VLYETCESYVWSLAVDAAGHVYAGTGPKGRIHQVTPDGKGRVFYATRQDHVLALAAGRDGLLYPRTDQGGLVYDIDARGKGFVLHSAAQGEVRRLLVTPDGVYAGTGSPTSRRRSGSGTTASRLPAAGDGPPATLTSNTRAKGVSTTEESST